MYARSLVNIPTLRRVLYDECDLMAEVNWKIFFSLSLFVKLTNRGILIHRRITHSTVYYEKSSFSLSSKS